MPDCPGNAGAIQLRYWALNIALQRNPNDDLSQILREAAAMERFILGAGDEGDDFTIQDPQGNA